MLRLFTAALAMHSGRGSAGAAARQGSNSEDEAARTLKRKETPTLAIDVNDRFAWMRLIVALAWGSEPRKMDRALATLASEGLGVLYELNKLPIAALDLPALSRLMGLRMDELARMPGAPTFYRSYFTDPARSARELAHNVFVPAGHFRAVADAPGRDRVIMELERAINGGAYLAGVQLALIATIAEHHPEMSASLNRAIAVMQAWPARGVRKLPSDRTLVDVWTRWRHLAPLWAAYAAELLSAGNLGFTADAAGLEAVHDPVRLRRILGGAKWFRSFAVSFVPERAKAPLVPPGKALLIDAEVEELEPYLPPLPPNDLAAAKAYRAPTRKFFP